MAISIAKAVELSLEHAEKAAALVTWPAPGTGLYYPERLTAEAQVHATLSEAYARLASAMVVNATSMHAALEAQQGSKARAD